jgi:hypothetical protein
MGLRHATHPTEGAQFHPESILRPHGSAIIRNFLWGPSAERRQCAPGRLCTRSNVADSQ